MKQENNTSTNNKKRTALIVVCIAAILALLLLAFLFAGGRLVKKPVLTIETPQKISVSDKDAFSLDVTISDMGEAIYPAASFSINFDSSRLEFLGVEEGNVFIYDDVNQAGIAQKLPDWSVNTKQSNKSGQINIMYLDLTGGKYAFSKKLLTPEDNVILRLSFRLRGSARAGDVCELSFADAVFAASDSSKSLAMNQHTLATKNGKIVVGEKK